MWPSPSSRKLPSSAGPEVPQPDLSELMRLWPAPHKVLSSARGFCRDYSCLCSRCPALPQGPPFTLSGSDQRTVWLSQLTNRRQASKRLEEGMPFPNLSESRVLVAARLRHFAYLPHSLLYRFPFLIPSAWPDNVC